MSIETLKLRGPIHMRPDQTPSNVLISTNVFAGASPTLFRCPPAFTDHCNPCHWQETLSPVNASVTEEAGGARRPISSAIAGLAPRNISTSRVLGRSDLKAAPADRSEDVLACTRPLRRSFQAHHGPARPNLKR